MKTKIGLFFVVAWITSFLGFNTIWAFELITRDVIEHQIVTEVDLIKAADNLVIMFDGSGRANKKVPGTDVPMIKAAKALLQDRNQWMPNLGYNVGLYMLSGVDINNAVKTIYPMQKYDRQAFGRALDGLPDEGSGTNYLQAAMVELERGLASVSGKTAVILFTDGRYSGEHIRESRTPVQIARDIAAKHDVAFYVISSAESSTEKILLERVSSINASSRVIPIQMFLKYPMYLSGALFTVKVSSYVKLTPKKEVLGFVTENMLFDVNQYAIRPEYIEKINKLGRYLQENPKTFVVTQGFTDNSGTEEHNLSLSEKRAAQLGEYLTREFGIDPGRFISFWYGSLNPVADNETLQGRQLNRRVEIAVGFLD